ncbi:DISARM system helicase DrmA [Methanosarcina sp.]|uniref:DISARM system helicase DrmA n=1 Tax=Methanosarcina sp. TaxID=2213 RepID=UPI002CF7A3CA|nr:DISARM system helicase DrmA [Methanosarcina sp.]HOW13303.1 DISARM system helicase DrmA [Methanosarcina sp.]
MRELFVCNLVKEVLGPRKGIQENINASPLSEYITGVLSPVTNSPSITFSDVDNEAVIPVDTADTSEEDSDDLDISSTPFFSPALDPKNRSSNIGLSFIVKSLGVPKIKVCLTWAKYVETAERSFCWQRNPRYSILDIDLDSDKDFWIDDCGKEVETEKSEISFHVNVIPKGKYNYFISLHLVNRIKVENSQKIFTEHHLFQPQIRVKCYEGTEVVPGIRKTSNSEEEKKLEFLYRNKPLLARGHLCSAMWKDIDPENSNFEEDILDFSECKDQLPFRWLDGELLTPEERLQFSPADIRTEFVPLYSIPSPDLNLDNEFGHHLELHAEKLAECWDPDVLRANLLPIAEGYRKWIDDMRVRAVSDSEEYIKIVEKILDDCEVVHRRIVSGIDILYGDDEARLAFCFANRAMDIQSRWSPRGTALEYRPFQLAFILMTLESIVNTRSPDRKVCDLLWIPTGGGKTEAYLAIIAFTIAYRRRRILTGNNANKNVAGVSVITRYTLRLLTIQQYRRSLSLITACEFLRVQNLLVEGSIGWRPADCSVSNDYLWGSTPFSIGLWVGGGVTPNKFKDIWILKPNGKKQPIFGALSILKGKDGEGEPAQILNCPACNSILSIPNTGLPIGVHTLHFIIQSLNHINQLELQINNLFNTIIGNLKVINGKVTSHSSSSYYTISIKVELQHPVKDKDIDDLWVHLASFFKSNGCEISIVSVRPARPGYFIRSYLSKSKPQEYDYEILCPDPECPLHKPWCGGEPLGWIESLNATSAAISPAVKSINSGNSSYNDNNRLIQIQNAFRYKNSPYGVSPFISDRIPITALTSDYQIYQKLPTVIVATVDKFARLPFEPRTSGLFGNVEYHHCIHGYFRKFQDNDENPSPAGSKSNPLYKKISPLSPPELIIQDELHLVEGPLGSLMGMYEMAVDALCSNENGFPVKYIASTATIRRAEDQVQAVFQRSVQLFPPHGLSESDRFFVKGRNLHPLDDSKPGRLYLGICALGRGPLTPLVRIWSRLLQTAHQNRNHQNIDPFWTLTGYFNSIRELGGARALYRQDIPQRIDDIFGSDPRILPDEKGVELSGRISSTELPGILDNLNRKYPQAVDSLFTTSMFGTGVDISRIGLMVVNGQPKTTSSYVQSTGRVGRSRGALVVTFLRASRPRDLNHYEFFCGYHSQIDRFIEPVTVYPFSPGVIDRALGPVGVSILRNMRSPTIEWLKVDSAREMASLRHKAPEVLQLPIQLEERASQQPALRRPSPDNVKDYMKSELDKWQITAARNPTSLTYVEYALNDLPQNPVVLGDLKHIHAKLDVVYENAPQSLRDIEETTGFQT